MGKVEIDHFSVLLGIFGFFCFTEMFIEYSSTFHKTFVQIGEFDWLSGRLKGSILVKMFRMKLKLGILARDIALYKSSVFYFRRIRTLVAMTT